MRYYQNDIYPLIIFIEVENGEIMKIGSSLFDKNIQKINFELHKVKMFFCGKKNIIGKTILIDFQSDFRGITFIIKLIKNNWYYKKTLIPIFYFKNSKHVFKMLNKPAIRGWKHLPRWVGYWVVDILNLKAIVNHIFQYTMSITVDNIFNIF